MEEEGPGAARRIEDPGLERPLDRGRDDPLGEPVGRVIFAETLPGRGRDDRLVEHLEDVAANLLPAETAHAAGQRADERFATGDVNDPVEEVGCDDAGDTTLLELAAAQKRRRRDGL